MHSLSFYFYTILPCASALWIQPGLKPLDVRPRSDPSFILGNPGSVHNDFSNGIILKRTDPTFYDGNYGKTKDGENRKNLLDGSFPDVYSLAVTALNHWDDTIFEHWFPLRDKEKVQNVLGSIIESQDAPPGEDDGAEILKYFFIEPDDTLAGTDNDLCAAGADAYTQNFTPDDGSPDYAICHFCPFTYESDDGFPVPPTLESIDLVDLRVGGELRISNEMEPIAATVLHEITHFNSVGKATGLPQADTYSAIIVDVAGPDPETDFGEPYWAWHLRGDVTDDNDPCLKNADSYVWFALESYWTYMFKEDLSGQGGYFLPPVKPSTD